MYDIRIYEQDVHMIYEYISKHVYIIYNIYILFICISYMRKQILDDHYMLVYNYMYMYLYIYDVPTYICNIFIVLCAHACIQKYVYIYMYVYPWLTLVYLKRLGWPRAHPSEEDSAQVFGCGFCVYIHMYMYLYIYIYIIYRYYI